MGRLFHKYRMHPLLTQADDFQSLRANETWADNSPADKSASLYSSEDYIHFTYAVEGHETEQRVITAIIVLATEMLGKTLQVSANSQAVLSEETNVGQTAFMEKRTYAAPSSDPYPVITALLAPIPKRTAPIKAATQSLSILRLRK